MTDKQLALAAIESLDKARDRIFGRGFRCVGDDLRGYFVEARYAGDPRVWMVPNTYPEGR